MSAQITCQGCNHGYAETALFCPNCGRPKVRAASGDALVGKLLGERFQVQALLGQGASGTIYRAEHVTLRRRVAIKVLHAELSRDDLAVERFRREATTVADIDNEHIVEIHDFGRTPDGRLYLAMELLEGETLDSVLVREKQLSVERTADILIQVGEALMEAHAIGYVHRDLRPRNIYLTNRRAKTNFVKLLDFGLAKLVDVDTPAQNPEATNLGMTFGDPRYMSPEQARGDRIDRRADIYQLGCVAYEMLTGAPPFSGNRVFDILTKQVTEAPAPLPTRRPGVPLWMEAAVAKMLAKDPENRFATTSRMVEALRRGLDTGEVMEDSIARRRESVPPASVSRVMAKLGIQAELPPPVAPAAAVSAPAPVAAASSAPIEAAKPPAAELPPRRSTGTPKVGVPVVKEADETQRPVTGVIEARKKSPSIPPDENNVSQVWYDEGDDLAGASRSKAAKRSPSMTDSLYDEDFPPPRRRWGLIIGALAVLLVGGTIVFAMSHGKKAATDGAGSGSGSADVAMVVPADAAPSTILDVDAGVAPAPAPQVAVKSPPRGGSRPAPARSSYTPPPQARDTGGPRRPSGPDLGFVPPGTDPNAGGFVPPGTTPAVTAPPNNGGVKTVVIQPNNTGGSDPNPGGITDTPEDPYGTPPTPTPTPTPTPPPEPADDGAGKAGFYANLGSSQLANGDASSAAASFKKALEYDPKNAAATMGMGEIALRQGLFGDAITHLRRAARLAPRNAKVFVLLGEAFLNSGNNAEAAANFKKALQLDPDNARARDGYNEASSRVPPPEE